MIDQYRFDLCRTHALPGDLNRVIRTAEDVPKTIEINGSPIPVYPYVRQSIPISFAIALSIFPEAARHADPRLADHQFADLLPHRVAVFINDIRCHPRQRPGEGTGLDRRQDIAGD